MSSPRLSPTKLSLDSRTFGNAPAAIYLASLLNQKGDALLARKVARILAGSRELIANLSQAHLDANALSTRSFAKLLTLISNHHRAAIAQGLRGQDPVIANLVVNLLEGGIKTWKQRVQQARQKERNATRNLAEGEAPRPVWAHPLAREITPEKLQERSKLKLARKGKPDTLY